MPYFRHFISQDSSSSEMIILYKSTVFIGFFCIISKLYTNLYENQNHNQGGYKQKTAYIPLKTIIFSVKVVKDCSATFLTSKKSQPLTTELFSCFLFPLSISTQKNFSGQGGTVEKFPPVPPCPLCSETSPSPRR